MSEVKVNKISPRSGTDVQLGDSGDTFTIPSGATINNQGTAVNFGATGSASWVTTVKTSTFTAVAGEGYFVNTTGGAVTVNLPAGVAGAVVAVKDYAGTFDTNAVTLVQNGSDKIGGLTDDVVLNEEGIAVTLVFIDSTQGWLVTDSGLQSEAQAPKYVTATGGTITTSGNFKIHTFTGPGTFAVSCEGNLSGSTQIDYLVVAGGGSGGTTNGANGAGGGGGGAGGYRESSGAASGCYTVSTLGCGVSALPVAAPASYPVTVGAGGASEPFPQPGNSISNPGSNSVFAGTTTITSAGGGGGTNFGGGGPFKSPGGSGGGMGDDNGSYPGGVGNTPPVTPPQGNNGGSNGTSPFYGSGGGGGASAAGGNGTNCVGGVGGAGATSSINGTPTARAGGGGGGTYGGPPGTGGPSEAGGGDGGGGRGSSYPKGDRNEAGAVNKGAGGGGIGSNPNGASNYSGKAGGSGIVIIRYKFQN
jgi:hypothetical protein